jgi:heptosyltransferase-1
MEKRILIVRLSAIGDTILSVPVLNALRKRFPTAKIAWVTEKASAQLLQGHLALDELFVVSKQTFKSVKELWKLRQKLQGWNPEITIDLQGLTKSSLIAWLSGAKQRLGFNRDTFDGRELSTFFNNHLYQSDSNHIVDRGIDLLALLGIKNEKVVFDLPEFDADRRFASQSLSELGITGPFCTINVGAGWPSKIWPSQRYADVANHLGKTHGLPSLVVWSGDKERLAAVEIAAKSSSYSKLAPATTLTQLRSLIRQSRLFAGSDTGPMHLAAALGVPTIGMIGPMPLQRVSPYGEQNIGVQRDSLPAHLASQRKSNCGPMLSIQVEDVKAACDTILNRSYQLETKVA